MAVGGINLTSHCSYPLHKQVHSYPSGSREYRPGWSDGGDAAPVHGCTRDGLGGYAGSARHDAETGFSSGQPTVGNGLAALSPAAANADGQKYESIWLELKQQNGWQNQNRQIQNFNQQNPNFNQQNPNF